MDEKNLNIYQKIALARQMLLQAQLKKTGENAHQHWNYMSLIDIVPAVTKIEKELNYVTIFSCDSDLFTTTAVNLDNVSDTLVITAPMGVTPTMNGLCSSQLEGARLSYFRRYSMMQLYNIIESDVLDDNSTDDDAPAAPTKTKTNEPGWRLQPATNEQKRYIAEAQVAITEEKFNSLTKGEASDIISELKQKKSAKAEFANAKS